MDRGRLSRRSLIAGAGGLLASASAHAQVPDASPVANSHIPRIRVGVRSLEAGLDGRDVRSNTAAWLASLAWDSPLRWNAENDVIPGLFTYSGKPSGSFIDLIVRQGAFYSDGTPVTAHDVSSMLGQLRDQDYGWRLQHVDALEVHSDSLLRIVFDRPDASLRASLAHPAFGLHSRAGEGTGPFRQVSDSVLERNPLFWEIGRPRIDRIELVELPNDVQRSTAAAVGEIDVLPNVPLLDVPMLQLEPAVYLVGGPTNILCHLQLNLAKPELANVEVRRVLTAAINRSRLVQTATANQAEATSTVFEPGGWTTESEEVSTLSAGDVRSRLQELGVPSDLRLHLLADNGDATLANTAVVLQEQLANCGISLSITLLEGRELEQARAEADFDLLAQYSSSWRDPHELVWPLLASDGSLNQGGYASVEMDTLLRAAIALRNEEFRRSRYARLERIVQRDVPIIPLFRPYVWDCVRADYPGYRQLPPATSRGLLTLTEAERP